MAVKIAILKVLNLETGENEESREESRPRQLTDEEAQNLARMLEETQSDTGKFFDHFGVTSFSDLTSNHYKEAVKMLGAKKRKAA